MREWMSQTLLLQCMRSLVSCECVYQDKRVFVNHVSMHSHDHGQLQRPSAQGHPHSAGSLGSNPAWRWTRTCIQRQETRASRSVIHEHEGGGTHGQQASFEERKPGEHGQYEHKREQHPCRVGSIHTRCGGSVLLLQNRMHGDSIVATHSNASRLRAGCTARARTRG